MELNINNLTIEVTRKCNMSCEHCLRGPSQRKTIDDRYIYKMLRLINCVSILNITGGEPTLAMGTLNYIRNCIVYGDCSVGSFYMATNGKSINVETIAEWAYDMLNCCEEDEESGIGFSFDDFHLHTFNNNQLEKQKRNYHNLRDTIEFDYGIGDFVTKHSYPNTINYGSLFKQGRAIDFGAREIDAMPFEIDYYDDNCNITETNLYLSCSGYIVAGCDWSYHNMDNNRAIRIAHIDDINSTQELIDAIIRYNETLELSHAVL